MIELIYATFRLAASLFKSLPILLIALLTFQVGANEKLQVSPPYWWVGMQSQELQLILYAKDLNNLKSLKGIIVQSKAKELLVESSQQLSNPNYLVVNLKISQALKPGTYPLTLSTNDKIIATIGYQFKPRNKKSKNRKGFNSGDSIYLITPDRFANGDTSNDSVSLVLEKLDRKNKDGRHGGDIKGIIDHLDYIEELGFTQIWITPLLENNNENYSYHGYGITDFYQIDPRFGDNDLYQTLSERTRNRGLGLIKDSVLNHVSINHPWAQDPPTKDWFNHQRFISTSHHRESQQDPHGTIEDQKEFTEGWFVPSMPDLNQKNTFVATYLIQNNIWWIEMANLSGLRLDTYSYSDKAFLTRFGKQILAEYPYFSMVGEEWSTSPNIVSYWQQGKLNHDGYKSYLPSLMDFPLQHALVDALKEQESWSGGFRKIYSLIATDYVYPRPNNLVVLADNHDMDRLLTQLKGDVKLAKMALVLLATTRGIPQVYYGTEILLSNSQLNDHGDIRTDFPGGWQGDQVNAFSGQGLSIPQVSMQSFVKKLFNWRKHSAAMASNLLTHYAPKNKVYVYFRHGANGKAMIILNKNNHSIMLDPKKYPSMLSKKERGIIAVDALSRQSIDLNQSIVVSAKQAMIIEINSLNR